VLFRHAIEHPSRQTVFTTTNRFFSTAAQSTCRRVGVLAVESRDGRAGEPIALTQTYTSAIVAVTSGLSTLYFRGSVVTPTAYLPWCWYHRFARHAYRGPRRRVSSTRLSDLVINERLPLPGMLAALPYEAQAQTVAAVLVS
jgi:hypothetical protein